MTGLSDIYKSFADLLGSLICHQLPDRSLCANGLQLPVCARDTGIYLGMFISSAFIIISGRLRSDRPPGIKPTIILCILMLPMMADGAGSYLGLYETGNTARLLTGVFFGLPIPLFLIPSANFKPEGKNEFNVLKSLPELAALAAAALLCSLAILEGLVPYAVLAGVFIASFLFFVSRTAYTIASVFFKAEALRKWILTAVLTVFALTMLYLVSSLVLQPAKAVFSG